MNRYTAIPISMFGKINTNYDVDEALPKPRRRWWDEARCKTLPQRFRNEVFFPEAGGHDIYKKARMYCTNCPVKQDCLDDAMREEGGIGRRQMIGMRGGLTPTQRYALFKEYKAKGLIKRKSNAEGIKRLGRFENHSTHTPTNRDETD